MSDIDRPLGSLNSYMLNKCGKSTSDTQHDVLSYTIHVVRILKEDNFL
jgi:hypothetical protein